MLQKHQTGETGSKFVGDFGVGLNKRIDIGQRMGLTGLEIIIDRGGEAGIVVSA
jgi:hypothetical protein